MDHGGCGFLLYITFTYLQLVWVWNGLSVCPDDFRPFQYTIWDLLALPTYFDMLKISLCTYLNLQHGLTWLYISSIWEIYSNSCGFTKVGLAIQSTAPPILLEERNHRTNPALRKYVPRHAPLQIQIGISLQELMYWSYGLDWWGGNETT